jgi:hypothetical protein
LGNNLFSVPDNVVWEKEVRAKQRNTGLTLSMQLGKGFSRIRILARLGMDLFGDSLLSF